MEGPASRLLEHAQDLYSSACEEASKGYRRGDAPLVRRAGHRAWKAACAATDAAIEARGIPRDDVMSDRERHYEFLDSLEERDLAPAYALFSNRLRGLGADFGALPSEKAWQRHMDALGAFIQAMSESPQSGV